MAKSKPRYRVGQVVYHKSRLKFGKIRKLRHDGHWILVDTGGRVLCDWANPNVRPLTAREKGKD